MKLQQYNTKTEVSVLVGMVQYYRDIWTSHSNILATLIQLVDHPKGRKILWNDALKNPFKEIKSMVSDETLLNYQDWYIHITVHTDASDKKLGDVISQNNKKSYIVSRILIKPRSNYNKSQNDIPSMVELLKHFQVIFFGYETNVF